MKDALACKSKGHDSAVIHGQSRTPEQFIRGGCPRLGSCCWRRENIQKEEKGENECVKKAWAFWKQTKTC